MLVFGTREHVINTITQVISHQEQVPLVFPTVLCIPEACYPNKHILLTVSLQREGPLASQAESH